MRKFLTRRALPLFAALVLCMSLAAPAFAVADTLYTPVAGTSTTFQKALILDENANVPDITFEYFIAAGTAVAYTTGTGAKMEIISPSADTGVTGTPTVGTADYNPGDATVTTAEGVTIDSGEKAALKTLTVNFANVTFAEPGIYRYLITETSAGQQGITYDTQLNDKTNGVPKQRTLDVYVTDNDGSLVVSQYVIHELVNDVPAGEDSGSNPAATPLGDKSKGFVNELATYDLTLSKTVTGNQGSHDKYFKFEVAITNAGANAALNVDWSDAQQAPAKSAATVYEASVMAAANAADDNSSIDGSQWVCDANGNVTKTVYLKHDQSIVIKGLASGAKWTITETPEDYKSTSTNATETTGMSADTTAAFTNTRDGVIPTGIVMSIGSGVAVVALGAAGIAFGVAKKNKKDDEE